MPNSAAWGSGFDAISDAIKYYMGLRQQSFENQRQTAGDQRAEEALQLSRNADQRAASQQSFAQGQAKRTMALGLAKSFGGQAVPAEGPIAKEFGAAGYGDLLTPEQESVQHLDGRTLTGGTLPINTETQPSGNVIIPDSQDDAMQRALINAQLGYYRTNANNQRALDVAGINARQSDVNSKRQTDARIAIASAVNAARLRGQDIQVDLQQRALDRLGRVDLSGVDDKAWDNYLNFLKTPEGLLQEFGVQMPGAPSRPPLQQPSPTPRYFTPPGAGRFSIIP